MRWGGRQQPLYVYGRGQIQKHPLMSLGASLLVAGCIMSGLIQPVQAAARTWDGGGTTNNWSECANWSSDACPVAGDTVTFNGTSTKDATVDASFGGVVTSVSISAGYTGTLTLGRSLQTSGGFTQAAGIFTAGSQTLDVNGTFSLSAGSFTASSGTMTVAGNFIASGGTFIANGGTVVLDGTFSQSISGSTTFFNLTKTGTGGSLRMTFAAGTTQTITGALSLTHTGQNSFLELASTTDGSTWFVNPTGSRTLDRLFVQDSTNLSTPVTATNSLDGGGNSGWFFTDPPNLGDYDAADQLGQATFTQNSEYGSSTTPTAEGMSLPQGTVIDTVHHRLFVSTCGSRVLVFNLDADDNLVDKTADYVLGQPNFTSENSTVDQSTLGCANGASYDPVQDRLFVPDAFNRRVLVFDLSGGITNGMNASFVLGQSNFTSSGCNLTQWGLCDLNGGSAYDPTSQYFYISDRNMGRVLVFDTTSLANGMNASFVLGQSNFTSSGCSGTTQSHICRPSAMALDITNHRLFVSDTDNARVLVFDTTSLANGMNASFVLGQVDFTGNVFRTDRSSVECGEGLAYDSDNQLLFAEDRCDERVMVFDVSTIANNEEAIGVIGQLDFTSTTGSNFCFPSQSFICGPNGLSDYYDSTHHRLYVSDTNNYRIMIFEFVQITTTSLASGTAGSSYNQVINSHQSQGTLSFSVTSGSLPPGLSLASNGTLFGTPTTAGTYTFTAQVIDDNGDIGFFTDSQSYSLTVNPASPSTPSSSSSTSQASATTVSSSPTGQDEVAVDEEPSPLVPEEPLPSPFRPSPDDERDDDDGDFAWWLLFLIMGLLFGFVWWLIAKRRRHDVEPPLGPNEMGLTLPTEPSSTPGAIQDIQPSNPTVYYPTNQYRQR